MDGFVSNWLAPTEVADGGADGDRVLVRMCNKQTIIDRGKG